jgi:hypothetical protein
MTQKCIPSIYLSHLTQQIIFILGIKKLGLNIFNCLLQVSDGISAGRVLGAAAQRFLEAFLELFTSGDFSSALLKDTT